MTEAEVADMKKAMKTSTKKPKQKPEVIDVKNLLSTGSTILNLGCSGHIDGGFGKGHYILLVGDTDSGKTWLSLTCLAEAAINPEFSNHRLIFDNAERGALMDLRRYFGNGLVERLEAPCVDDDGLPSQSQTLEEFYYNVDDALKDGRPFIYILDSEDVLTTEAEKKKFDENKQATRKGKEQKGSMTDAKAKINSSCLRKVVGDLCKTESILIIVNQTRDAISPTPFGPKKSRSGGWALEFYATLVLWAAVGGQISRTVRKKKRQIGVLSKIKIKRSRMTGKKKTVMVPIYHSTGFDDVGSCVDYLVSEGTWKSIKGVITVTGLGPTFKGDLDTIVKKIEDDDLFKDLQILVGQTWDEIEQACRIARKSKY